MTGADLVVTNFNRNFTGVSATMAGVVRLQQHDYDMRLTGHPLPGCPAPISKKQAIRSAQHGPSSRPFQIWHVRRNPEMQTAIYARDILRLPIRIVFTSAAQRRHSAWPRFLISRMDRIIATTDAAASYFEYVAAVVPHGVDTALFRPADDRAADWAATGYPGRRGIACIGRIRPEKGTDRFVDTAIRVLPKIPDTTALVIGKGKPQHKAYLQDLKNRVDRAGLRDRILFVGEVSPAGLPDLLRSLSLLIALPRYEGYGMTPLEAMASGVPIIASDTGHFRDFLGQDRAGMIIASGDPAQAAAATMKLLTTPALHQQLSNQCVQRAAENFSISQEAAGIASVYEKLWAAGRG